jgi:hypothetical protein
VETQVLLVSGFEFSIVHVEIEFFYIFSLCRGTCVVEYRSEICLKKSNKSSLIRRREYLVRFKSSILASIRLALESSEVASQ